MLKEFHVEEDKIGEMKVGQTLSIDMFSEGQKVDVTGITIGKGFAGAIKRHHFSSNRSRHGNSVSTNAPGSIGNRQDPGRVFRQCVWPVTSVMSSAQLRTWLSPVWTPIVN